MKRTALLVVLLGATAALAGCNDDSAAATRCESGPPYAILHTSLGDITLQMLEDVAPNAVAWFLDLAESGHYDGTIFHEVIRQGSSGLALGGDRDAEGNTRAPPTPPPAREIDENVGPDRIGRVMLGAEGRFFILFGPAPQYRGDHTIFAQVANDIDIVAGLAYSIATDTGQPWHPVVIEGFTVGCQELVPRVRSNFATPLTWDVRGHTDQALVWVHNGLSDVSAVHFDIRRADGEPVDPAWTFSFDKADFVLASVGQVRQTAQGPTYPAWGWTLASLTVPEDEPGGVHEMILDLGAAEQPFLLRILPNRTTVSQVGDTVLVQYIGRFADNHEQFDQGTIEVELGSGETVPGFDLGLVGTAVGEQVVLHLPAALAYGYDIPDGSPFDRFEGRSLDFGLLVGRIGDEPA